MTYSRPTTRTVDALARVPTPMAPSIIGDSQVTRSAHGAYLDNRSASVAQQNALSRASEVTNFIEGLTKVAQPLVNDFLTKQARDQVGNLLATQDPVDLIRSADPEKRAIIRGLSPQAQDMLQDKAAQASATTYSHTLSAELLKRDAILKSPTASPEEIAKARADAKAAAMDQSGFMQMAPTYITKYSDQVMQIEAELDGRYLMERTKAQDADRKTKFGAGLRSVWSQLSGIRVEAAKSDNVEGFAAQLKANVQQGIVDATRAFTPAEQAQIWGENLAVEVQDMVSADRYEDAWNLLTLMDGLAKSGISTPSGADFFDQKLQNGTTLRYAITKAKSELYEQKKRWENEQFQLGNMALLQQLAAGEQVDPSLIEATIRSAKNPEQLAQFAQLAGSLENYGSRVTEQDQLNEADFRMEAERARQSGNYDPQEWYEKAKQRGLKASQLLRLTPFIAQERRTDSPLAMAIQAENDMSDVLANVVANVTGEVGGDAKQRMLEAKIFAAKETQSIIDTRLQSGERVTREEVAKIYQNSLEAWAMQTVNQAGQPGASPSGQIRNQFLELETNLGNNGGRWTVDVFPKSVAQAWRNLNPNKEPTVRDLQKLMVRLGQSKDKEGKPVIENVEERLRQMGVSQQVLSNPFTGGGAAAAGRAQAEAKNKTWQQVLFGDMGAQMWEDQFGGGAKPKPEGKTDAKGPQSSAPKQSSNPFSRLVGQVIGSIAQVVTPPAAAGTLDAAPVVNADAVEALSKVWTRQRPLDMRVEPLPQVVATASTAPAPLRIANDRHPMFIAIGISEGTRTANGGYTRAYYGHRDPGNGVWNVGTVSGQQGGSPQSSDRRWMARLTQRSVAVAPLLQRVGLSPGTQGWNRMMFNILDLEVQAPAAARDLIAKLPQIARGGFSIEAIAKARADSFFSPRTGRLDAPGFGNNYNRLFRDQRSRAGVWDYRRRL